MKPSPDIKTFGCKLNYYDSQLIKKQIQNLELSQKQNIIILNSCAVTAEAGKTIRKEAKKIKKEKPNSLIVLTGCGAQVETELYEKTPEIDIIVGNSDKQNLTSILQNWTPQNKNKTFKSNIFKSSSIYSDFVSPDTNRTRAFLKIQDGCDSFCTFCIIPFARGKSKSLSKDFLVEAIKTLEDEGVKEVVLTGVHIGDYKDGDISLEKLVAYILNKTNIPRLRLTSLEPVEITESLLECYKDERMCPHFHISLQSTNTKVLKTMKRKYGQKEIKTALEKIEKLFPHAFVGMDVIVGFPSESEKDFKESYKFLKEHSWTSLHVFPYSPRKGTYAYRAFKNLPHGEVIQRSSLLRALSKDRLSKSLEKQPGTIKKVLLFKQDNKKGLSRDYWKVKIPPSSLKGEKDILITGTDKNWLTGTPLQSHKN